MNSNFPGETGLDSSEGSFELSGEGTSLNVGTAGEQSLGQGCRGCLLRMYVYCWGMLIPAGGYSTSLRFDNIAWGECTDLLTYSLGN